MPEFSPLEVLEFNQAFVQQQAKLVQRDIERLSKLHQRMVQNLDSAEVFWQGNSVHRPSQVLADLAWNKEFQSLMDVRLRQIALQKREIETEQQFPTEWAEIQFEQQSSISKLNNINRGKTREVCQKITEHLQGENTRFVNPPKAIACKSKRGVLKCTSKSKSKVLFHLFDCMHPILY